MAVNASIKLTVWQMVVTPKIISTEESKPFVARLVDDIHNAGIGNRAVNLFYNEMPHEGTSPCLVVRDMGGSASVIPIPEVSVLFQTRANTWTEARRFAAKVFDFYQGATDKQITEYRIVSAEAQGMPASMGEDENQRHLVGFNMSFRVHSNNQDSFNVGFGGRRDPNEV